MKLGYNELSYYKPSDIKRFQSQMIILLHEIKSFDNEPRLKQTGSADPELFVINRV